MTDVYIHFLLIIRKKNRQRKQIKLQVHIYNKKFFYIFSNHFRSSAFHPVLLNKSSYRSYPSNKHNGIKR